ncbi:MAG: hypothetical protein AAGA99_11910 [Actinomycetota bacterium]
MRRFAVLVIAVLFLAACGDSDDDGADTTEAPAETTAPETTSAPTTTATETTVTAEPAVDETAEVDPDQQFPDVVGAELTSTEDGVFTVAVTLSSPYDTPERYADAWRVLGEDGTIYGVRELAHDHQFEQPFTRSLSGVEIPAGVTEVTIEGRDQVYGWGGTTITVPVPAG